MNKLTTIDSVPLSRRRLVTLAGASVLALALGGCSAAGSGQATGSTKDSGKLNEVHIGDQPSFITLKIADAKGFFKDEFDKDGITIKVDNFVKQGSAVIEALKAGSLQAGVVGSMPLVAAVASGSPFKLLTSVNYSKDTFKLFVAKDSPIKSVKDLKGKKLGVKFSSNEHEMALTLLKQAGLTTQDVQVANISAEDSLNSLLNGSVDATVLRADQLEPAQAAGAVAIADNSQTGLIVNGLIATEDFISQHGDIAARLVKVLYKTVKWIDENEDETLKIFIEKTKLSEKAAKTSFESRQRAISVQDAILKAPIERTIGFSLDQKLISKKITVDDVVDTSVFEKAGVSDDEYQG